MREKICLDRGWMFHRGDLERDFPSNKTATYRSAKTERALWGPASRNYPTGPYASEPWTKVDLPHDYVIEELPDQKYNEALGFVPYGNAWYIKKIHFEETDKNRRILLYFEGVASQATVYVNGCLMKHNFCGYTGFEIDITDVVRYGEDNTVSVYVSTQQHEGWWYEGGGIYRHVWLIKTDLISVDLWGVYAKPVRNPDGSWTVETETTIRNDGIKSKTITVSGEILDREGRLTASAKISGTVKGKDKRVFRYRFAVASPSLWSPEHPVQYTMRTTLTRGSDTVDVYEIRFGFRSLKVDPVHGLFLNGKHYKIKGLCGHADCGLTGKAVPDNLHRYKVELMKEMGANGYRTTHYPQAEALMDALDENGFLVMDETRWFESTEEGKEQLEMLIKRDRNRPGVIFWSIGNEEPHHATEEGRRIAQTLKAFAERLDDSRIILTAVAHTPEKATVFDELEVLGINYNWDAFSAVHNKYPGKAILSTENCATGSTRGWYFEESREKAFLPAYDRDTTADFKSREYTWKFLSEHEWILGGYQWIAFEHRGEAKWPRLCSQSGAIDLFMQKKDAFYQNQSHWSEKPMVHLLPHWNFRGMEGEPIRVCAYTNASRLELFLNGVSQGSREIEKYGHGEWTVVYAPGKLEVRAYNGDQLVAQDVRITSGNPRKLMLSLDSKDIHANGKDIALLSCYAVDENGNEVYDAAVSVSFFANSLGKIYSTGSDITEHDTIFKSTRRMRAGRIGVAVKLGETPGVLKVYAQSEGLESAVLTVQVNE
ncbi:MAG: glycoside hydrolase family 2 TIM barrel-domain containing protein [Eubacteriales bacterium]